ncbi:hypothetical protein HMH01_15955 [Halovulum dunhuangense]|uniref:Uncharacterized protein n=1 Tax=Halovulum dunhuangense TaxID=1505036 RepID=A0A849L718_9RHOB|nr:hypothetical protein [Halovulum dunhuangense]NNU81932.1 hypothetical protein [Halovulum dunhuangense]
MIHSRPIIFSLPETNPSRFSSRLMWLQKHAMKPEAVVDPVQQTTFLGLEAIMKSANLLRNSAATLALLGAVTMTATSAAAIGIDIGGISVDVSTDDGLGVDASIGGDSGVNASANVGGSGGLADVDASVGGSDGLNADVNVGGSGGLADADVGIGGGGTGGGGGGGGGGTGGGGMAGGGGGMPGTGGPGGMNGMDDQDTITRLSPEQIMQMPVAQNLMGATLVSTDRMNLGFIQEVAQINGDRITVRLMPNPALGLSQQIIFVVLNDPVVRSGEVLMNMRSNSFLASARR